jgi:Ser/Thr protein kinase RdoA (MazF antagonist)
MHVMSPRLSSRDAQTALRAFLADVRAHLIPLGNRGGFSGAELWRVEGDFPALCLKAWPEQAFGPQLLERMHALMLRARRVRLTFVPEIRTRADGATWIKSNGRYWDLTTWMPGQADFHQQPTAVRLAAASGALAQIHAAWQSEAISSGPCPSIDRRLEALADWNRLLASGWRLNADETPEQAWRPLLKRAWDLALTNYRQLPVMLAPWITKTVRLQPCIGDVWHDHILFEAERVSGIIDYGAVRIDHPAADLGRLIGSLVADDDAGWATALAAYRAVRALSWEEESLARLLDRSGAIVSLFNWLRWCGRGERSFSDPVAVTTRLTAIVERLEKWSGFN